MQGVIHMSTYLKAYKVGDIVDVKVSWFYTCSKVVIWSNKSWTKDTKSKTAHKTVLLILENILYIFFSHSVWLCVSGMIL